MREDPGVGCGYGRFLRWLLRRPMSKYADICEKHDDQTSLDSPAQRIPIPGDRIVEWWADAIDHRGKQPDMARQGFFKQMGRFSKTVIRWVNRWFYEGPR